MFKFVGFDIGSSTPVHERYDAFDIFKTGVRSCL